MGDELALRHDFAAVDTGRPPEVLGLAMHYLRQASAGEPPYRMAALVARGLLTLPRVMNESFAGHCEVAQRLAGRLGLAESLVVCLGQIYERWGRERPPARAEGRGGGAGRPAGVAGARRGHLGAYRRPRRGRGDGSEAQRRRIPPRYGRALL
jgi:hypothetical protein